jgi:hypothetical protein
MLPRKEPAAWPINTIVTGGGGANLHASFDHPALVRRETANHFMVFDVTREALKAKTIRADGTLLDQFQLVKTNGRFPPAYLAWAYPEESFNLYQDVAPSLAGRAVFLPDRRNPTPVLLTVQPRKKSSQPAQLEITLSPESAHYYQLLNGPILVTTPPKGATSQNIWAEVRATGLLKIKETVGRNLSPPLIFQAKARGEEGDTVAFGIPARLSKTAEGLARKQGLLPPEPQ